MNPVRGKELAVPKSPKAAGWTIGKLFRGRPEARRLYNLVEQYIRTLGEIRITPGKTQVAFGNGRKFAWVWLPQMWIQSQPDDSITVAFALPYRVLDPRIKESVEPVPGRWTHHRVIRKTRDFDRKTKAWLSIAFETSSGHWTRPAALPKQLNPERTRTQAAKRRPEGTRRRRGADRT